MSKSSLTLKSEAAVGQINLPVVSLTSLRPGDKLCWEPTMSSVYLERNDNPICIDDKHHHHVGDISASALETIARLIAAVAHLDYVKDEDDFIFLDPIR